jgi:autotransporter-associated beta strand protein
MKLRRRNILGSIILSVSIAHTAAAATFYWDGTTGNWNDVTKWSTDLAGTTDPAAAPLATVNDALIFNTTPGNSSNSIVYLNGNRGTSAILASLTFNNAGTTTLLGGISGTAANNDLFINGFTVNSGSGAVTIGDTSASPTARVNIKAGSISFTNNSTSLLTLANGLNSFGTGGTTTFTFTGSGNTTMAGVIGNGTGANVVAITKSGAGTLTLSGVNTNTGATTVTGGTLTVTSTGVINNANTALAATLSNSVSGGATLRVEGGTAKFNVASSAESGLLLGTTTAGNVVVTSNGTLTVSTGRMILGGSSAGSGTSTFTQDSGTTTVASNLYTGNFNASDLTISGGSFTVNGTSIISQRANTNFNISGNASVVFTSSVTLGGQTGSYTPIFNLNGGTLSVVNIADSVNGTSAVNFNGGTLQARADNADFLRADAVTIGNSGGRIDTQAFNVTVGQNLVRLSGATTDALTKIGSGRLTLTGTNTYGGGSSVSAGTLQFGTTSALPSSGAYAATGTGTLAVNAGGVGEFSNATSGAGSIGAFFSGASFVSGTAFGIDTSNAGGSLTYAGDFAGTGIGITKLGTGALNLSGNNSYTGATTINAGTLQAGSATAFAGTGALVMANAAVTFDLNGNNASFTNLTTGSVNNTITTSAAGSGTDTLTLSALSAASGALFSDNGTRKLALNITVSTLIDPLSNASNTFSGGLTLIGARSGAANNSVASGGKLGRGTITMGTASQIYFQTNNVTIDNPFIINSAAGNGSRAGAFRVDSTGNILSGQINANLADAAFINGSVANGSVTLTGQVTGLAGLQVNSNAVGNPLRLTLSNTGTENDYAGNTTVSAFSTLILGASNQISNGASKGNLALTGTLDLNGYNETINGLSGAGSINNATATGGATNTLTIGDNNAAIGTGFTGTISNTAGSLAVSKIGTGALTLSGNNSFSGGLTISSTGVVTLTHNNGAGTGAITLQSTNSSVNGVLVTSGGRTIANSITIDASTGRNNISNASGVAALQGDISIINNAANIQIIQNNASDNALMTIGKSDLTSTITAATFSNNLSFRGTSTGGGVINSVFSASSMTVDFNGATNWTINSTGNNWGAVTGILSTGNVTLGATNALDTESRLDHGGAGDLILNGFNQTIAGLNRSAAVVGAQIINNSTTSNSQLTIAGMASDMVYANVIADGSSRALSLVMNSAGRIQTLTATNTYTGTTTVTAGTLQVGNNTASGTLGSGNVLNDAALIFNRSDNFTVANNISGSGTLTKLGAGVLTLTGTNSYTGNTVITAGSIQINSAGALGGNEITMSGTGNSALVLADAISAGTGKTLAIRGGGVGGFFGALTNAVGSTGTSEWQGSITIGDATGTRVGAQGGTLLVSGNIGDSGLSRQLVIRNSNGGKTILSGVNTYTGETLINASGGELQVSGGSAIHDSGLVNIANSAGNIFRVSGSETIGALTGGGANGIVALETNQTLTLSSGTQTFAGVIQGNGILAVNGASQTLSGQNTFVGGTVVTSGTLTLGHATNTLSNTASVDVSGGVLALGSNSDTVGAVRLISGSITASGAGVLTGSSYDVRSGSVSAGLAGAGVALTKSTIGTVTLSAANTYTGATNVNAGKLVISSTGSTVSGSAVTVANAGSEIVVDGTIGGTLIIGAGTTLSGSGTISGATTISGLHNPGNSPGIQTFNNNLSYQLGSVFNWELGANTTTQLSPAVFDQVVVNGNLDFAGSTTMNLVFNFQNGTVDWTNNLWDSSQSWTVYSVTGDTTNFGNLLLNQQDWADSNGALFNAARNGAFFSLSLSGNNVLLNYTAVPEASVTLLGGLSALLLLRRRRVA